MDVLESAKPHPNDPDAILISGFVKGITRTHPSHPGKLLIQSIQSPFIGSLMIQIFK